MSVYLTNKLMKCISCMSYLKYNFQLQLAHSILLVPSVQHSDYTFI